MGVVRDNAWKYAEMKSTSTGTGEKEIYFKYRPKKVRKLTGFSGCELAVGKAADFETLCRKCDEMGLVGIIQCKTGWIALVDGLGYTGYLYSEDGRVVRVYTDIDISDICKESDILAD